MSVKRNASVVVSAGLIFGLVIGASLGVLWWRLAPRIEVVVESGQLVDFQTKGYLASDISYGALAIVAGLLVTIGLARMRREHLISVLVAGVLSGLVGSLAMWWVGHYLGRVDVAGLAGTQSAVVEGPLVLHMGAMVMIWSIVAAMVVTVLAFEDWLAGLKKKN